MFQVKDNEKIGAYLKKLILERYKNVRQFCIDYLKLAGQAFEDDTAIQNMSNRMSQIIKGDKAIQTYDLPIFCELLQVSCEEILSAGKHFVPISGHVTNYEIAFSRNREEWEAYIDRPDKLILNSDEYNKTVIDYALEFGNYDFMKYLMDKRYIWFVDDSENDTTKWAFGFCAGTSIKRRDIGFHDTFGTELRYHCEERGLRQKMIALAMENNDFEMLTSLRAREIPTLYQLCDWWTPRTVCKDYYNENVIEEIEKSSPKVFKYFSEDFTITDRFGHKHRFIYPYMNELIKLMVDRKNKYVEAVLRCSIKHNECVYKKLREMIDEAFEVLKKDFYFGEKYKEPVETVIKATMEWYKFHDDNRLLSYHFSRARHDTPRFCANVVSVEAESDDFLINSLIEELNKTYDAVRNIQPDTSKY